MSSAMARTVLLLAAACVYLGGYPSRCFSKAESFVLPAPRRDVRQPRFVGRAAAAGADARLEQFVRPKKRIPGHSVLAVFRAAGLTIQMFVMSAWAVPAILLGLPVVKRKDPVQRKYVDKIIAMWTQMTTWPWFSVKVKGKENLPPYDEAVIYVANHQSFMDILSCYHLWRPFKWVSKASILKIPIIGWAMKRTKTITIKREDRRSQLATLRECIDTLKKGTSIFIFPEGTRSLDGKLLEFQRGPILMAKKAKVPIQPITILGTGRLMPSKKEYYLYQNSAGVEIIVHPRLSAEEVQDTPDVELLEKVRSTIESAMPAELQKGTVAS